MSKKERSKDVIIIMNTEITINDDKNSTGKSDSEPGQKSLRNEEE